MAKKGPLLCRVEYIFVRSVLDTVGILPRRTAIGVGIFIARLAFVFLSKLKRIGIRNLEIAFPEKSDLERKRILNLSIENLGRNLGEVSKFARSSPEDLEKLFQFDFEKPSEEQVYYEEQVIKGRGTILAGPHLGNWELGVFAYSATRGPISYLARPLDNPLLEDYLAEMRARFGNRAINKSNSFRAAIDTLREGKVLGVLPDVNVQTKDGIFVPFFGTPACTTVGVAMLAKRTNAMILPMCNAWIPEIGKYVARHGKLIEPARTGDNTRDLAETTAAITKAMEGFIREFPDQWIWIHKRWKTRPPGEPDLYE